MPKKREKKICLVCDMLSADFFTEKNGFDVFRCRECGLLFVHPIPEDYLKIYSKNYFSGTEKSIGYADYEGDEEAMAGTFEIYLKRIENIFRGKGKLLDVGAATGHFVKLACGKGWKASGIEISDYAVERGRKKGFEIVAGNFETLDFPGNQYDAVTFWDVLEHFRNPERAIQQAGKTLKPGGLLAVNTPDSESLAARIMSRRWHAIVPPNHLHIFGRKNLERLLAKNNFEIVEAGRVGKKFSLRFIFKVLAGWKRNKILEKISAYFAKSSCGKLKIPLDVRDNMFIVARKKS